MKLNSLLLAGTALIAATGAQAQTQTFSIDPALSHVTVTANPRLCLGSCAVTAALASSFPMFKLSPGESETFDFATFNIGSGFGAGSATIDAQLGFLDPIADVANVTGTGSYFRLGGFLRPGVSGGVLTWNDPVQHFTASNGSAFTATFNNVASFQFGSTITDRVTITLDSVANAVPEPATWAMMLVGFAMVGAGLRYRRKSVTAVIA